MLKAKLDIFNNAGIYLVTSSEHSNYDTLDLLENCLKAGVKLIQLREKTLKHSQLYNLAKKVKAKCSKYGALLIINDYIDIALSVGADGVHLGQDDLPCVEARKLLGKNYIIGVSTHNVDEIVKAQNDGATYLNIGPVFKTNTKEHFDNIGISGLTSLVSYVKIPYTLMGGIKEDNIKELREFNPSAFAFVTEITKSKNIDKKIKNLFGLIKY